MWAFSGGALVDNVLGSDMEERRGKGTISVDQRKKELQRLKFNPNAECEDWARGKVVALQSRCCAWLAVSCIAGP